MELENMYNMNSEDNETKILVAQIGADAKVATSQPMEDEVPMSQEAKEKLREQIREFDIKIQQDNKKLDIEKEKVRKMGQAKKES